jgi:hypothetical protein
MENGGAISSAPRATSHTKERASGGEGGIRTLDRFLESVSCRGFVARSAIFAIVTAVHYPKLLKSSGAQRLC